MRPAANGRDCVEPMNATKGECTVNPNDDAERIRSRISGLLDMLVGPTEPPTDDEAHAVATGAADILDEIARTLDHGVSAAAMGVLTGIVALDVCRVRGGVPAQAAKWALVELTAMLPELIDPSDGLDPLGDATNAMPPRLVH